MVRKPNQRLNNRESMPKAAKLHWKPSALLVPAPAVLVTCRGREGKPNIITIAWAGTVCSDPPMLTISVRPERYSHGMIRETGEFVVNVPSAEQAWVTDYCGVVSGRVVDKFAKTGLAYGPADAVRPPILVECPLNIECKVRQTLELGSHTTFVAEVLAVQASAHLLDPRGRLALERAGFLAYAHGHYYALGKQLGHFGFSVRKRGQRSRRDDRSGME
jgi:flavin reductase (DIM6/NTAB) family NADH-FMN oxidoreductase RutF